MSVEFRAWPKTPRLFRDIIVTEKIDGTNAAVHVLPDGTVAAQSRTRLITPEDDNFGFAKYVRTNADELAEALGEGTHFGEWWGSGIQRGYGLGLTGERRFSLFNVARHAGIENYDVPGLHTVPVLYEGPLDLEEIDLVVLDLRLNGSRAAAGFDRPEGIVVFHTAANQGFKVTLDNDGQAKSLAVSA